jgi:hypothetical protein
MYLCMVIASAFFLMCIMLISVLCGPVHVCNYIRFTYLFAFTVILILFTLWLCPISFCNDFWDEINDDNSHSKQQLIPTTALTD